MAEAPTSKQDWAEAATGKTTITTWEAERGPKKTNMGPPIQRRKTRGVRRQSGGGGDSPVSTLVWD